jgi:hypothetical protein
MFKSKSDRPAHPFRKVLGLGAADPRERVSESFQRLSEHIRKRREASDDENFRGARRIELERLEERMTGFRDSEAIHREKSASPRPWLLLLLGAGLGATLASAFLWLTIAFGTAPEAAKVSGGDSEGWIAVRADPPDSALEIFLSATEEIAARGIADGSTLALPAGAYRFRVHHPDCPEEWLLETEVESEARREFSPRLCRGRGTIRVESNVERGRLLVDGEDRGSTGDEAIELGVGAHRIRVEKPGHTPWEGRITLLPDQRLDLRAELEQSVSRPEAPKAPPAPSATLPAASGEPPPTARGNRSAEEKSKTKRQGIGGSKSWHDAVKHQLLLDFDRNASRSLDLREEIQAIPCSVWRELEASYETGGLQVEMTHLYGFDGSDAPANTLGVTFGMRGYAYDRMKGCGLKVRH